MKRKNLNNVIYGDRSYSRSSNLYDFDKGVFGSGQKGGGKYEFTGERCYKTHPPLTLPGTDLVIHGGSCSSPVVTDADVYIGFDSGMTFTGRQCPWKDGHEFLFKIRDMDAPNDANEFRHLVAWTKEQLGLGRKVHCGCIGGHGRTGTFLAALCSEYGEKDAITYVRANYCKKAVESSAQVKFLEKEFDVKPAPSTKGSWGDSHGGKSHKSSKPGGIVADPGVETYRPVVGNGSIWDRVRV